MLCGPLPGSVPSPRDPDRDPGLNIGLQSVVGGSPCRGPTGLARSRRWSSGSRHGTFPLLRPLGLLGPFPVTLPPGALACWPFDSRRAAGVAQESQLSLRRSRWLPGALGTGWPSWRCLPAPLTPVVAAWRTRLPPSLRGGSAEGARGSRLPVAVSSLAWGGGSEEARPRSCCKVTTLGTSRSPRSRSGVSAVGPAPGPSFSTTELFSIRV